MRDKRKNLHLRWYFHMFIFAEVVFLFLCPPFAWCSITKSDKIPSATGGPPAFFQIKRKQRGKKIGWVIRSQRSYFLISHLQELGIHISGTLPFLVEQELVVAAISTNGCMLEGNKKREEQLTNSGHIQSWCTMEKI